MPNPTDFEVAKLGAQVITHTQVMRDDRIKNADKFLKEELVDNNQLNELVQEMTLLICGPRSMKVVREAHCPKCHHRNCSRL